MLALRKITITHFKNYDFSSFSFDGQVIAISGLNGKGKTNLLDAIYYSCFTKSYFSGTDLLNINFEQQGFRLEAFFDKEDQQQKTICIYRGAGKKEFSVNDIHYEKFSKHIGLLPVVMIAPDDIGLVTGASDGRRKFIDTLLSQLDPGYLQQLITYNKILLQRNSLLKKNNNQLPSITVLEILDQQLIQPARIIHEKRSELLKKMIPLVQSFYKQISGNAETITLEYVSQLQDNNFESLLLQCRNMDLRLQRSTTGIHKDDIGLLLNGQAFRQVASQGQRKSLLFALKLAEFELLKSNKGFAPLLLLDDVFEKLDNERMQNLLQWVCKENNGQVFITDTHKQRLEDAFDLLKVPYQIISL